MKGLLQGLGADSPFIRISNRLSGRSLRSEDVYDEFGSKQAWVELSI